MQELVTIIGNTHEFQYYVTPGRARILLRAGDAIIFARKPPVLKLNPWSAGAPTNDRIYFRSGKEVVEVIDSTGRLLAPTFSAKAAQLLTDQRATLVNLTTPMIRLNKAVIANRPKEANKMQKYTDSQGRITNWTEFFREEMDIYVRNLTESNISLQIGRGDDATWVSIPRSPDPVNLTAEVSFDEIKKSQDFRKIVNALDARGKPLLQVMNQEDFETYFSERAASLQIPVQDAISQAEQIRRDYFDRSKINSQPAPQPIHTVVQSGTGPKGAARVGEKIRVESNFTDSAPDGEQVRDKLEILIHQLKMDVAEEGQKAQLEQRAVNPANIQHSAKKVLSEVQSFSELNTSELELIRSAGYWKTVKSWASKQLEALAPVEASEE